jgi:hypothetical protein
MKELICQRQASSPDSSATAAVFSPEHYWHLSWLDARNMKLCIGRVYKSPYREAVLQWLTVRRTLLRYDMISYGECITPWTG